MVTKLITFNDLNRYSSYSTAIEHLNVLFHKNKVLWGQWSATNQKDNIENSTYKQMNNNGQGCVVYAYDKNSMLIKLKVSRVLKTNEVLDEKLEEYIQKYYCIQQPVHYYLEVLNIIAADLSQAKNIITDSSNQPITNYSNLHLNNNRPWNVHELEDDNNNLLIPKNIFLINKNIASISSINPINSNNFPATNYSIYRIFHKDLIKYPNAQYIGETNNLERRLKEHFNPNNINNNKTENRHLYVAMYLLGLENFTYEILETNIKTELEARSKEAYWIDKYNCYVGENGLNKRKEKILIGD